MSDDRDDQSEQFDDDKLGADIGADDQPGGGEYPPDEPLGVEDPTLEGEDDLATRQLRRESGDSLDGGASVPVEPDPSESPNDEEERLLGEAVDADEPIPPAEEAALHVEEPPPDA